MELLIDNLAALPVLQMETNKTLSAVVKVHFVHVIILSVFDCKVSSFQIYQ